MSGNTDKPEVLRKALRFISIFFVISGFAVLLYVNGVDFYAQYMAEKHIQSFTAVYNDESNPERLMYKSQAQAYNASLAGQEPSFELLDYNDQLFYQHEPMMSYIEIPKISVKQPIYHGLAEIDLMAGVGHLETSSLPIGGDTSHCVLLGHSGMQNTRMFDDLPKVEIGDEFVVWTLNEPYAYRVYNIETVLPEEVDAHVELVEGHDLITLITCTPYGVNTHRLLVHAQRCDYDAERMHDVKLDAYINDRTLPLLLAMIAVGLVAATSIVLSVKYSRKGKTKQTRQHSKD